MDHLGAAACGSVPWRCGLQIGMALDYYDWLGFLCRSWYFAKTPPPLCRFRPTGADQDLGAAVVL